MCPNSASSESSGMVARCPRVAYQYSLNTGFWR